MIKSIANGKEFIVEFENGHRSGKINSKDFNLDILEGAGEAHVIYGDRSFRLILEKKEGNDYTLRVNGKRVVVNTKDKMALLLESMGLSNTTEQKVNQVKAPMPGLVLRILVEPGTQVSKGDPLLVLEAMKMENMIKSPGDATVSAIKAQLGQAVEKNQILIEFA
ncbi:MAG: acetyl-CoA carboxylase biotin carboxyl carrier protein subunit [Bacteroidia bacterium]